MAMQLHSDQPLLPAATATSLFTDDELAAFDSDDVTAGSAIARILCTLFIYTLLAMIVVILWTVSVVYS